eukprot:2106909-Amphidinium_carterae.1
MNSGGMVQSFSLLFEFRKRAVLGPLLRVEHNKEAPSLEAWLIQPERTKPRMPNAPNYRNIPPSEKKPIRKLPKTIT